MQTQKDEADRSKKKRKKEEESNNRRNNQQRNGGNRNNHNNSKIRIDRKARSGPTSKCKKHPDSNHAWGDCHLNPSNPNNKLGNRNSKQNRNGGYDRNNQQYDRNRYQNNDNNRQQPRQLFYEDDRRLPPPPPPPRDNYSNQGPPSQVSVYSNQSNNDHPDGRYVWIPR